ncbi:cilia- and flagella-associated protein 90 isoform X2 [Carettochelys insculpta]|uniref:cilia- and flagella-associated protein 90 isoform X2 n=1 Tax=Carettochelys insculpta TaxID=44489 RepID=UPI003EB9AB31
MPHFPAEAAGQLEEESAERTRDKPGLPLSARSAFSYVPPGRRDPPEHSYFHRPFKTGIVSTYDSIFKRPMGYNEKLHRCDREHAHSRGLNINDEVFLEQTILFPSPCDEETALVV